MKKAIFFLLVLCSILVAAPKVVCIKEASSIDKLAAKELCGHLKQITGEEYTCVEGNAVAEGELCIFVGLSDLAKKRLGRASRLSEINEQGCVVQGHKGDLFLYGKGRHGNLYAFSDALSVLQTQRGIRYPVTVQTKCHPGSPQNGCRDCSLSDIPAHANPRPDNQDSDE